MTNVYGVRSWFIVILWCSTVIYGDFPDQRSDYWNDDWAIPNINVYVYIYMLFTHGVSLGENPHINLSSMKQWWFITCNQI